ncbi:hypothetical protein C0J52_07595 [Blattella germanica]|nr:hypothetical protein C0J52_07595 [Blattella germanica]
MIHICERSQLKSVTVSLEENSRAFLCCISTIQQLVKKVCEAGSFSDKKINRRRTVLTEEKLDDIAYLLENSPNKSLSKLSQQVYLCLQSTKLQNFLISNRINLHFQVNNL